MACKIFLFAGVAACILLVAASALERPPMPGFTLMGNVYYSDGSGAGGVPVKVSDKDGGVVLWEGKTDENGFFNTGPRLYVNEGSKLEVSTRTLTLRGVGEMVVEGSATLVNVQLKSFLNTSQWILIGVIALIAALYLIYLSGWKLK